MSDASRLLLLFASVLQLAHHRVRAGLPSPAAPSAHGIAVMEQDPESPEDAGEKGAMHLLPEHQRIVHDLLGPYSVAAAGNCASPRQSPTAEGIRALHARKSARTSGGLTPR